ncbi:MAG: nitrate reductase cytochrome c-type subunit, partial [Gammaproteobacteria bacterium]
TVLSDVSPRRYFCLQCHIEQTDAEPLIENTFKRVDSLQ